MDESRYDVGSELDAVLWMKTLRRGRPLRRPARIALLVAAGRNFGITVCSLALWMHRVRAEVAGCYAKYR